MRLSKFLVIPFILCIFTTTTVFSAPPETFGIGGMEINITYGTAFENCARGPGSDAAATSCRTSLADYRTSVAKEDTVSAEAAAKSFSELRVEVAEELASDPAKRAMIEAVFAEFFSQDPSDVPLAETEVQKFLNSRR